MRTYIRNIYVLLLCACASPPSEDRALMEACAASNAIVAEYQSNTDGARETAGYFARAARRFGATEESLQIAVTRLAESYSEGNVSWEDFSDAARRCRVKLQSYIKLYKK